MGLPSKDDQAHPLQGRQISLEIAIDDIRSA
jgi:hypothetical protein